MKNEAIDKTLDGLYSQFGELCRSNGLVTRFLRWLVLKEIKKLERLKEVKKDA